MKIARRRGLMAALLACLLPPAPVLGETMAGPFYNEATKSYFALLDTYPESMNWEESRVLAARRSFKNVRGRLAIIPDINTDRWLVNTFRKHMKRPAFIGLRYWCRQGKLQWVDGSIAANNGFARWHNPWYRSTRDSCPVLAEFGGNAFMAVHYDVPDSGDIALRAAGPMKKFEAYLVEFPTGAP